MTSPSFCDAAAQQESRFLGLHGLSVEVNSSLPELWPHIDGLLRPFELPRLLLGRVARGSIRRFEEMEVISTLPNSARRVDRLPWMEIYQDGQQFWLVDESWGILEIHFGRNYWRSWVLATAQEEPVRLVEKTVLWPMAQLLRQRGVHLIPAPSVARGGIGVLLLTGYSVEPELTRLAAAGYQIIGQRWTALREENGRVKLLHLPGVIQRCPNPRRYTAHSPFVPAKWIDLHEEFPDSARPSAWCDAVLIVEASHRHAATANALTSPLAQARLRRIWPMVDLQPQKEPNDMIAALAHTCACAQAQLSRHPDDFRMLLDSLLDGTIKSRCRRQISQVLSA